MVELRDYQTAALRALSSRWEHQRGKHLLVVAPTGSGKSLMIASLISEIVKEGGRVLVLCHRQELIEQDTKALLDLAGIRCGIYSAGLGIRDMGERVTVAGIQSIGKKAFLFDPWDVVIVDEAHLIPRKSETLYKKFLDQAQMANPKLKIVGFTATPYRLDSGYLHEGKGAIFDDIAYDIGISELIKEGWLSPVISKGGIEKIDVSGVHLRGVEYIPEELAHAAEDEVMVKKAVEEIVTLGQDRKGWIVFCSSVKHAQMVEEAFLLKGIQVQTITGETPSKDREKWLDHYKGEKLRCLVNVNVLTTGFDAPHTDLIALLRPTKSAGLYIQMVGRGCRVAPGKADCLVLDYAGCVMEHGPIDQVRIRKKGEGGEEAPAKECPKCQMLLHISAKECPECGYIFPERKIAAHDESAYEGAVLSDQIRSEEIKVDGVRYYLHQKAGKPDSIRVEYRCGLMTYREWLCPAHSGLPRGKFVIRWNKIGNGNPPGNAQEFLDRRPEIGTPDKITIRQVPGSKFIEVVNVLFEEVPF